MRKHVGGGAGERRRAGDRSEEETIERSERERKRGTLRVPRQEWREGKGGRNGGGQAREVGPKVLGPSARGP